MKTKYAMTVTNLCVCEDNSTEIYGICGFEGEDITVEYMDLHSDRDMVAAFVKKCNDTGLDPEYLPYAIENFYAIED